MAELTNRSRTVHHIKDTSHTINPQELTVRANGAGPSSATEPGSVVTLYHSRDLADRLQSAVVAGGQAGQAATSVAIMLPDDSGKPSNRPSSRLEI